MKLFICRQIKNDVITLNVWSYRWYYMIIMSIFLINLSDATELSSEGMMVEKWEVFEKSIEAPIHGNPYIDVEFSAIFSNGNTSIRIFGFYDGNGIYKIRFMPNIEGDWQFATTSSLPELNEISGGFTCVPARNGHHGPVQVSETFHFRYADGIAYAPVGTTIYNWINEQNYQETLDVLENSGINKVRFCLMPFNNSDGFPEYAPWEGSINSWDFSRPSPDWWAYVEQAISDLEDIGVQADVILFHPYDFNRWGLGPEDMTAEEREFFIEYAVKRLAHFSNVWWSMANEFSEISGSSNYVVAGEEYFEPLAKIVVDNDPYGRMHSIHSYPNRNYDWNKPWCTHVSIQSSRVDELSDWRDNYKKPIINDEYQYEGDTSPWGRLSGEECTRRMWISIIEGGYGTHGEAYGNPETFTLKGGVPEGTSFERCAWLSREVMNNPSRPLPGGLTPVNSTEARHGDDYILHYYGNIFKTGEQTYELPEGSKYRVEVLDTWNMTIVDHGQFVGTAIIDMGLNRRYLAVRITKVENIIQQLPFGNNGLPWPVPGVIKAENFDIGGEGIAYHDTTFENLGSFRQDESVDVHRAGVYGVNHARIGYSEIGEWIEYTVNIEEAGPYKVSLSCSRGLNGPSNIHLECDGVDVSGLISIESTGAWNIYKETEVVVELPQGVHVIRFFYDDGAVDFSQMSFEKVNRLVAFPGAEGAGKYATGGRGGEVYIVDNLNDSGPGSFRHGLETSNGSRTIIFNVGGIINLDSRIRIEDKHNITIAGQTSAGDGITIAGQQFKLNNCSNIIMRYLRFRLGADAGQTDTLSFEYCDNIIVDRVSVSWGTDANLETKGCSNMTIQWCLISEALNFDGHAMGGSIRNNLGPISLHHNIWASCRTRSPTLAGGTDERQNSQYLDFVNNVIYNVDGTTNLGNSKINFDSNYYKAGPNTDHSKYWIRIKAEQAPDYPKVYAANNFFEGIELFQNTWTQDNYTAIDYKQYKDGGIPSRESIEVFNEFDMGSLGINKTSALEAYENCIQDCGASLRRGPIDTRVIDSIIQNNGTIIDYPEDVGGLPPIQSVYRDNSYDSDMDGMPNLWEIEKGLNSYEPTDARQDSDGDGYTNLENYLHGIIEDKAHLETILAIGGGEWIESIIWSDFQTPKINKKYDTSFKTIKSSYSEDDPENTHIFHGHSLSISPFGRLKIDLWNKTNYVPHVVDVNLVFNGGTIFTAVRSNATLEGNWVMNDNTRIIVSNLSELTIAPSRLVGDKTFNFHGGHPGPTPAWSTTATFDHLSTLNFTGTISGGGSAKGIRDVNIILQFIEDEMIPKFSCELHSFNDGDKLSFARIKFDNNLAFKSLNIDGIILPSGSYSYNEFIALGLDDYFIVDEYVDEYTITILNE